MILPVGEGMGATQLKCAVMSPMRAAGIFSTITVADPFTIIPGPAGTQGTMLQGMVLSVMRADGGPPINDLNPPVIICSGIGG